MAIKQIDTGIFHRILISNLTKSERNLLRQEALEHIDIEARLQNIAEFATALLCNHKENPEAVRDANMVLNYIGIMRDAARENNINDAMLAALNLGQASIMLYVRPHEPAAKTGRKNRAHLEKMRAGKSKRTDSKHNKVLELFNDLKNQYEPHERPSNRELIRTVAEHLRMKFKTAESILFRASPKSAK